MLLVVQSCEIDYRTLPDRYPFHAHGRIRGSVHIARDCQRYYSFEALGSFAARFWFLPSCLWPRSRSICEPLADDTTDRAFCPFNIIDTQSDPIAVPEIEFG